MAQSFKKLGEKLSKTGSLIFGSKASGDSESWKLKIGKPMLLSTGSSRKKLQRKKLRNIT
ncbi:MAG: hypothetical protein MHPSP_002846, partial [Paramarteilia canceri]